MGTGEGAFMVVDENCNAATSPDFLRRLRAQHCAPLIMIWGNSPAHRGPEKRAYLTTPDLRPRLVVLQAYSPDLNPDEAICD
ncbi:MAG: transposase [Anaerolineae bacterium]